MNEAYNLIGLGFARDKDFYSAQTFAQVENNAPSNNIACGSHIIQHEKLRFMVAIKGQTTLQVNLVINNENIPMSMDFPGNNKGSIYSVDASEIAMNMNECMNYHFAIGNEVYPVGFELKTDGFGNCKSEL